VQNLVRIDSAVANLRMHEENVFSCEFYTILHTLLLLCSATSLCWISYNHYVHITQPSAKSIPNCDVSFANDELL